MHIYIYTSDIAAEQLVNGNFSLRFLCLFTINVIKLIKLPSTPPPPTPPTQKPHTAPFEKKRNKKHSHIYFGAFSNHFEFSN